MGTPMDPRAALRTRCTPIGHHVGHLCSHRSSRTGSRRFSSRHRPAVRHRHKDRWERHQVTFSMGPIRHSSIKCTTHRPTSESHPQLFMAKTPPIKFLRVIASSQACQGTRSLSKTILCIVSQCPPSFPHRSRFH